MLTHPLTYPLHTYAITNPQLRDDLLSMLVAGHETTGSALTWTLYLLATNPDTMAAAQARRGSGRPGGAGRVARRP